MEERLQKILARAGIGSRRSCEELIAAGRVRVGGKIAVLGTKADPKRDKIDVDGRTISQEEESTYIALNKPRGVISAAKGQPSARRMQVQRRTVRDLVPIPDRLYPVGRLDVDSEGLILLTNDGELANRLTHPRYGHEKEYRVLVASRPDDQQLAIWRRGVVLEDETKTAPAQVRFVRTMGKGAWLRVVMREGRKRQIREVGKTIGLPVVKIIRVRIGTLQLGSLKPGEWRYLDADEIAALKGEQDTSKHKSKKVARKPERGKESSRTRRVTERGKRNTSG